MRRRRESVRIRSSGRRILFYLEKADEGKDGEKEEKREREMILWNGEEGKSEQSSQAT